MAVFLALVCAAAWGSMEVLLLRSAKAIGALRLNLWLMIFGGILIAPVVVWTGSVPSIDDLPIAVAPALVGLAASTTYMLALRDGMLSLVSPTVATSGGLGAVLAVVLLGERLTPIQIGGLTAAVVGVVLVTSRGRRDSVNGMGWAVASALLFGSYTVTLAIASDRLGPVWAVVAYRITGLVVLGAQFSTVAVVLATVVLRERLQRHQWIGVALMLTATALLAATR